MSYPGEPDLFFERILGWPVGNGTCWVSIRGGSRFILEDLGSAVGLFDVTEQSDNSRSVVNLQQIMSAPSQEDVRSLVEAARDEALMDVVAGILWSIVNFRFFISWTGERLDLPPRGLLSRDMGDTSRSHMTPAEVLLERETAVPVISQSAPASVRVSNIDGFSWVFDELVRDMLGRAVFVIDDVFLGDKGLHSADWSRVRISQVADDEIVSWRERRFQAYEVFVLWHRKKF